MGSEMCIRDRYNVYKSNNSAPISPNNVTYFFGPHPIRAFSRHRVAGMICAYVPSFFLFKYFRYGKKYTAFLHIAKLVVDRRAEHPHRRRQAHVGVDKRRYVVAILPDGFVEYLVVFLE